MQQLLFGPADDPLTQTGKVPLITSKLLRIGEHALTFDGDAAVLCDSALRAASHCFLKNLWLYARRVTWSSPLWMTHAFPS